MVVIGAGRVGLALSRAANDSEEPCLLLERESDWSMLAKAVGEPVLVATRNDDLDAVLGRVPQNRRGDLVFLQNGALSSWLSEQRLQDNTRGLLFFAAPDRETGPICGPQPSPFAGPHALAVVRWMSRIGVDAQVVDWPRFRAWELEKIIWNCAFGVLCDVHDTTVGRVCTDHREQLAALVDEFRRVGRASMNVDMPLDWLVERLVAYSLTIPGYRAAIKEFRWRDGWFQREAARLGLTLPLHTELVSSQGKLA